MATFPPYQSITCSTRGGDFSTMSVHRMHYSRWRLFHHVSPSHALLAVATFPPCQSTTCTTRGGDFSTMSVDHMHYSRWRLFHRVSQSHALLAMVRLFHHVSRSHALHAFHHVSRSHAVHAVATYPPCQLITCTNAVAWYQKMANQKLSNIIVKAN